MTPPAPPFPVPSSFPFQASAAGSHTSILMFDSGVGFSVAATRQNAGTVSDGGAAPLRPCAPGTVNGPAGTAVADVIVVSGSARRSEEHTSELQSLAYLVCRLLLEKKKKMMYTTDD